MINSVVQFNEVNVSPSITTKGKSRKAVAILRPHRLGQWQRSFGFWSFIVHHLFNVWDGPIQAPSQVYKTSNQSSFQSKCTTLSLVFDQ